MSTEITTERIDSLIYVYSGLSNFADVVEVLKELKAERAKPKVWDGAPDWCNTACVGFYSSTEGRFSALAKSEEYTRELPKSRARIIAEETASSFWRQGIKGIDGLVDKIEAAINEALEAEK